MTLPPFLLVEVRAAFRSCSRQNTARRSFTFTAIRHFNHGAPSFARKSPSSPPKPSSRPPNEPSDSSRNDLENVEELKDLVPTSEEGKQLDGSRKSSVPMRVVPKAEIAPNTRISPQERLHIEHLTRHPPPPKPTKPYRENLLVYHLGTARVTWMIFSRCFATTMVAFATFLYVPAYWNADVSIWWLGLAWGASLVPVFLINWVSRGILTEIRLKLPPSARQSAQAAMTYARNLPRDATIEARFQRWTSHTAAIVIRVADLVPAHHKVKPVNFKWVGPRVNFGSRLFPNPTDFWVNSKTASGKAARDTVPGIWDVIYKRLTGAEATATHKWKG